LAALAAYAFKYFRDGRVRVTTRMPFGLFFAPAIWIGWLVEAILS